MEFELIELDDPKVGKRFRIRMDAGNELEMREVLGKIFGPHPLYFKPIVAMRSMHSDNIEALTLESMDEKEVLKDLTFLMEKGVTFREDYEKEVDYDMQIVERMEQDIIKGR